MSKFGQGDRLADEKQLENAIIDTLLFMGALVYQNYNGGLPACARGSRIVYKKKNQKARPDGHPDLWACYRGHQFFIEVKDPSGVVSAAQTGRHEALRAHGCTILVIDNLSDLVAYMNQLRK